MAYGGLISAALGATQGAGDIATKNIDAQRDVESKTTLYQRELEMKAAFEDSVAKNMQVRHAAAGAAIDSEFNNQKSKQLEADTKFINDQYSSDQTSADIATMSPKDREANGLINASRSDDMAVKADIAERLGYADHAKTFRDQQQIELGNTREANRDKNSERRMDIQEQFNEKQALRQERAQTLQENHYRVMEGKASDAQKSQATQSFRSGISTLMSENRKSIEGLQKEMANATPELQKTLETQIKGYEKDNLSLNASLKSAMGIAPEDRIVIAPDGTKIPESQAAAYAEKLKGNTGAKPAPVSIETKSPQAAAIEPDNSMRGKAVRENLAAQAAYDAKQKADQAKKEAERQAAKIAGRGYRGTGIQ